jgi:hypothetical protein
VVKCCVGKHGYNIQGGGSAGRGTRLRVAGGGDASPVNCLVVSISLFHEAEETLNGGIHLLEKHLGVNTHEHNKEDHGAEDHYLSRAEVLHLAILLPRDLSEHHPLEHPKHVDGAQHHPGGRDNPVDHIGPERTEKNKEFTDKPVCSRQGN